MAQIGQKLGIFPIFPPYYFIHTYIQQECNNYRQLMVEVRVIFRKKDLQFPSLLFLTYGTCFPYITVRFVMCFGLMKFLHTIGSLTELRSLIESRFTIYGVIYLVLRKRKLDRINCA